MDHVANGDLRTLLSASLQPLTWTAKRKLCAGVARGLEYLHTRKPRACVHGDLKVSPA